MTGASAKPTALVGPEGLEPHSRLHASRDIASAWTPGPWKLRPHAKLGDTQMYWVNGQTSVGTQVEADAHLISAAPELYEALTACIEQAIGCARDHYAEQAPAYGEHIVKGLTALAKARGES